MNYDDWMQLIRKSLCREGALAHCWPQFKQIKLPILFYAFYGGYRTRARKKNWPVPEQKKQHPRAVPPSNIHFSPFTHFTRRSPDQPITFKSLDEILVVFAIWSLLKFKGKKSVQLECQRNQAAPSTIIHNRFMHIYILCIIRTIIQV